MAKSETSYQRKLKDPRWQKKRLEVMQRDKWKCRACGDEEETLNVHHRYYMPGYEPWEYEDSVLVTLCEPCHEVETNQAENARAAIERQLIGGWLVPEIKRLYIILSIFTPEELVQELDPALDRKSERGEL